VKLSDFESLENDSDISDGGLPTQDLVYVVENGLADRIEKRREQRRLLKAKTRIEYAAIVKVLADTGTYKPKSSSKIDNKESGTSLK
jgi:hypothetical protein